MAEEIEEDKKKSTKEKFADKASSLLFELITDIPGSLYAPIQNPDDKARLLAQRAAWKSATVSTSMPPMVFGASARSASIRSVIFCMPAAPSKAKFSRLF